MFAFQQDSYRTELRSEVVSCTPEGGAYDVILRDTIAFAESGGQPSDAATLEHSKVLELRLENGAVVHRVGRSFEVGDHVSVSIGWRRRFDFMQQHSAQHLITAVAEDRFGWRTTSFHLGDDYSAIELDVADVLPAELARLEAEVNEHVRAGRPIESRWVSQADYASLEVRSRGLPTGHVGDVRLVEIGGVDVNTCGGTHVRATGELQLVHFTRIEPARGGSRIVFLAGERVRSSLAHSIVRERALGDALSVGPDDFLSRIEALEEARKSASRDAENAWGMWSTEVAARLSQEKSPVMMIDLESSRMDLLAKLAESADPEGERLFFGTAGGDSIVFLLRGPEQQVNELGPAVAHALGGRGGGRAGRYQGKGDRVGRPDALKLLNSESA
jgi:Ser-tRNA(Ala) deacylase AlaX